MGGQIQHNMKPLDIQSETQFIDFHSRPAPTLDKPSNKVLTSGLCETRIRIPSKEPHSALLKYRPAFKHVEQQPKYIFLFLIDDIFSGFIENDF